MIARTIFNTNFLKFIFLHFYIVSTAISFSVLTYVLIPVIAIINSNMVTYKTIQNVAIHLIFNFFVMKFY